jgi:Protein of unknown function (DUF3108)
MRNHRLRLILCLLTIISILLLPINWATLGAQPATLAPVITTIATEQPAPPNNIVANLQRRPPFSQGEKLVYELRLSRFPIYGLIGTLTFTVDKEELPWSLTPVISESTNEAEAVRPKQGKKKARLAAEQQAVEAQAVTAAAQENLYRPLALAGGPAAAPTLSSRLPQTLTTLSLPAHLSTLAAIVLPPPTPKIYWKVHVRAESKGILTSLFRVDVDDSFVSWIDPDDFGVVKTVKQIDEGRRRREMTADFDRTQGKVKWVDIDSEQNRLIQMREEASPQWVTDIAAGWYVLRGQPLALNQVFTIPLSDDAIIYPVDIEVLGEELVDTDFGSYPTYKIDMKLFDGKYFRRRGKLILWVTKDPRHIPLKAQIRSNYGTVNVTIAEMRTVDQLANGKQ